MKTTIMRPGIKKLLEEKSISMSELGRRCGLKPARLSYTFAHDVDSWRVGVFRKVADVLGVTKEELYYRVKQ